MYYDRVSDAFPCEVITHDQFTSKMCTWFAISWQVESAIIFLVASNFPKQLVNSFWDYIINKCMKLPCGLDPIISGL